jgi:hypothetical protein
MFTCFMRVVVGRVGSGRGGLRSRPEFFTLGIFRGHPRSMLRAAALMKRHDDCATRKVITVHGVSISGPIIEVK